MRRVQDETVGKVEEALDLTPKERELLLTVFKRGLQNFERITGKGLP